MNNLSMHDTFIFLPDSETDYYFNYKIGVVASGLQQGMYTVIIPQISVHQLYTMRKTQSIKMVDKKLLYLIGVI